MRKLIFVSAFIIAGNVSVAQDGSYADLLQQGDNHSATVTQEGDLNESYVVQKSVNNVVNVNQINTTGDRNVYSRVEQTGKSNLSTVNQHHNGDSPGDLRGIIHQNGDFNIAFQEQGPHGQMGETEAIIRQKGNHNLANQYQLSYGNDAEVLQTGNYNVSNQTQNRWLPADGVGHNNTAYIIQSGRLGIANQDQYGVQNYARSEQNGNTNVSNQIQNGALNHGRILQESNLNIASQNQFSASGRSGGDDHLNDADIKQEGGFFRFGLNVALQQQETPGGDINPNFARIMQNGSGNYASQLQTGGNNSSTISQTGNSNVSTVVQHFMP